MCKLNEINGNSENSEGRMTYEVEVESNSHNNRFYELRNRSPNALHDILHSHSQADALEFSVSSYDDAKKKSKYHWKEGDLKLDMLIFGRVESLRRLCLHMNNMMGVTLSQPFQFGITELALFDVDMTFYSFSMLTRSVGQSIQHLCLHNVKIIQENHHSDCVPSDFNYLKELERVRSLETLRVDCDFQDIAHIIKTGLSKPLESLFLKTADIVQLHDFEGVIAKNIYVTELYYKGKKYGKDESRELQMATEDWRRKMKTREVVCKVVLGAPKSWSPSSHQTPIRQLAQLGKIQLFLLVTDEEFPNDTLIETVMKMYI